MFERLLHIHQVLSNDTGEVPIQLLNEGLEPSYGYGLAICFDLDGKYRGVRLTEGNADVVYINGPSHQGAYDYTCVSKKSAKEENVTKRLLRCLNAFKASPYSEPIRTQIEALIASFDVVRITKDLEQQLTQLDTTFKFPFVFVSWIDKEGDLQRLYLNSHVQAFAVSEKMSRFSRREEINLVSENQTCSVCGKMSDKVLGNFSLIACYNLDKPGLIAGGMNSSSATRNFPVCESCALGVSHGWNFANRRLTSRLAGEPYLLLLQARNLKVREFALEEFLKNRERTNTLKKDPLETITNSEDEILEELAAVSEGRDFITASMVFFEENQAAWRIRAEIHEILPSRIREVYRVKRLVESDPILTFGKGRTYGFTLATLRQFTGSWPDKWSKKQFFTYLDGIFSDGQIDRAVFFRDATSVILTAFKREADKAAYIMRDAWATYWFLYHLKVLTPSKGEVAMPDEEDVFGKFMIEHKSFFHCWEKKVAFLTGCYVNAVAYIQRENLNSAPFLKKVQGIKMGRPRLQRLYCEANRKLRQYRSFGLVAKDLDPHLARAWVNCGDNWNISDDESTFAFTLGLSLAGKMIQEAAKTADVSEGEE